MISQNDLQSLIDYNDNGHQVLSLYLDVDCRKQTVEAIKLQAKGMLKEVQSTFTAEVKAIEKYLDLSHDWSQPGLVIFTGKKGDFFSAYPTAVPFRNRLRIGHKPYVKPLAHLLDHYAHYGVIIVDRVGARFLEFHLGDCLSRDGYMGEPVHKLKKGGGSSAVGMRGGQGSAARHEDEVVQRNLREAAAAAHSFFSGRSIRRLFLGGTSETVSLFQELLPKQWQSYIAGTFTIDMTANEQEIRDQTLALLTKANDKREKKLVDRLISTEAQGGNAVLGLDATLQAVVERRVQALIISDGYRQPGYVQSESGYIIANLAKSPLSLEELTAVDDVVDAACSLVMSQGGHVEIISDNPALEQAGHIGALLHY